MWMMVRKEEPWSDAFTLNTEKLILDNEIVGLIAWEMRAGNTFSHSY